MSQFIKAHLPERLQEVSIDRKAVKAFHHGHQDQQVAIDDHKQQHGHMPKKPRNGADLRIGRRVKKRREIQAHLQTDDFTRQFHGRKHQPDRETDRKAHGHLLSNSTKRLTTIDADDRLITQHTPARTVPPETPVQF